VDLGPEVSKVRFEIDAEIQFVTFFYHRVSYRFVQDLEQFLA
jgi:hypothetical protein